MYYFKYDDYIVYKYLVKFNRNEMITLRNSIINNCSELVHREIICNTVIKSNKKIKNLKQNKVGEIYHYSYDEYVYPRLVSLIDLLLKNDDTAIEAIIDKSTIMSDIKGLVDGQKKIKLMDYYDRLSNMLSFELMDIINFEVKKKRLKTK